MRKFPWPFVVAALSVAITVVRIADIGPPIAPLIALVFVLFCPGLPYVRMLDVREPLTEAVMSVALSISIEALVSVPLLVASAWTADRMLAMAIAIAMFGAIAEVRHIVKQELDEQAPVAVSVAAADG
jgi:hypothetical protein